MVFNVIKLFFLGSIGFSLAFLFTPVLTNFLYKHKLWKKEARTKSIDGKEIPNFLKFHSAGETNIPRLGGLLIWATVLVLAFFFFFLSKIIDIWWIKELNFLSRSQTWLPLFALVVASLVGLSDDLLQILDKGKYIGGGLRLRYRLILMASIGLIGGLWFYYKLGYSTIHIPGNGDFLIGIWYVPLFILVMMAVYSGGIIDGLDGLAGGVFAIIFEAFAGIALFNNQIDLAVFCAVTAGAISAFLWFNIPPARFYMGETGMTGLCATLTVVAFLTDSILVLPIIGFLLVIESGSLILQLGSKKIRGKAVKTVWPEFFNKRKKNKRNS